MKYGLLFVLLVSSLNAFSKPLLGQDAKSSCNVDRNCTECVAAAKTNGCVFLDSDVKYKFPGAPALSNQPRKKNVIKM